MPVFGPIRRQELIRVLRQLGFDGPFSGTRHQFMVRGALRLRVPNPHQSDIDRDLLAELLRQAEITRDEWEQV